MLFAAASTYAPGEPGSTISNDSLGQKSARYSLQGLGGPNLLIGLGGLLVVAWLAHKYLGVGR